MAARNYGQYCGVTTALEVVGERWALLIVRDLLVGPRRYTDLKTRPAAHPHQHPQHPTQGAAAGWRYAAACPCLTGSPTNSPRTAASSKTWCWPWAAGGSRRWANRPEGDVVTSDSMTIAFRTAFRADVAATSPTTAYEVRMSDIALGLRAGPARAGDCAARRQFRHAGPREDRPCGRRGRPSLETGPGLRSLISGERSRPNPLSAGPH